MHIRLVIIFSIGIAFILDDQNATASYDAHIHSYESFKDHNHSIGRKSGNIDSLFTYVCIICIKVSFNCSLNNNFHLISYFQTALILPKYIQETVANLIVCGRLRIQKSIAFMEVPFVLTTVHLHP